jgi:hypothetical protein
MHPLVEIQHTTRKEIERILVGLSDEDAQKRVQPMNCISWIIAHIAQNQYSMFVAWAQDIEFPERFRKYRSGNPPLQPPLDEAMALWEESCRESDKWLDTATESDMRSRFSKPDAVRAYETAGTLVVRNIFHTWSHAGEMHSIRQVLGHKPPDFVQMHGWQYQGVVDV